MPEPTVTVRTLPEDYTPQAREAWIEFLETTVLGGAARGARVLLKPNLCAPPVEACTHPDLIAATAGWLVAAGAARVVVGESSVLGVETRATFATLGLDRSIPGTGASLVDISAGPFDRVRVPEANLGGAPSGAAPRDVRVARAALEADLIVSFAKLKTVRATVVSLTLKNLKGVLAPEEKRRFHHQGVHESVAGLYAALTADRGFFGLIDGCQGLDITEPRPVGVGLAGTDGPAVDAAGAILLGFDPSTIKHLALASRAGLGDVEGGATAARRFRAETGWAAEPFSGPAAMASDLPVPPGSRVLVGEACTGCLAILSSVLRQMKADGSWETALTRTVIAVGPGSLPAEENPAVAGEPETADPGGFGCRLVAVGNCAIKACRQSAGPARPGVPWVEARGCPPHSKLDLRAALDRRADG